MTISPKVADWKEVSVQYPAVVRQWETELAHDLGAVLRHAGLSPERRLLEVGCGSGHLSMLLRREGYSVDLVDFEPNALEHARRFFAAEFGESDTETAFIEADLLKLSSTIKPASYSVVWNSGVMEHFSAEVLVEGLRQMREAATDAVLVVVPNPQSMIYMAYRAKWLEQGTWDVGVEFLREDYDEMMRAAGLEPEPAGYCGRAATRLMLNATIGTEGRQYFDSLLQGGLAPAQTLYLQYMIGRPKGARVSAAVRDAESTFDKTFYLDAIGAANGSVARLERSLAASEREAARLRAERDAIAAERAALEKDRMAQAQSSNEAHAADERLRHSESELSNRLREQEAGLTASLGELRATLETERVARSTSLQEERLVSESLRKRELELSQQWRTREAALTETLGSLRASLDITLIARARATQRIEDLESDLTRFKPDAARAQALAIELDGEHARLGAAQSELRRLQELLHATQDKLTRSAGELTRVDVERTQLAHTLAEVQGHSEAVAATLHQFKDHRSFRVAHYLQLAKQKLFSGSVSERARFSKRVIERALMGRHKGEFSSGHALDIPAGPAIDAGRRAAEALARTAPAQPQHAIWIPSPVPDRAPAPRERAPHGKRTVAMLTNMVLDWYDQRPRFGGGERYCLTLARLFRDLGLDVRIFQPASRPFESHYYGVPVTAFTPMEWYGEFNPGACRHFTEITKGFDHVYVNLPEFGGGTMREDAIMTCHGIWFDHNNYAQQKFRTQRWFELLGRSVTNPRRIVSVDTNSINVVRALWPELAPRMTFIPNFFDGRDFYPGPPERAPGPLRILFPRRSQVNRGSRILEHILKLIPHDVRFYWVGEGDAADTQLILDVAKNDPRLSFHRADFYEMPEWYRHADITVIPTIACEGTSLSCIEALACGSAVVSTHVGGLSDLVQTGNNGILTDPTPESLAEAINTLIEDRTERERLRAVGPESVTNLDLGHWRHRWARILVEEGWVEKATAERVAPPVRHGPSPLMSAPKSMIVTRNAMHGGVETIVAHEARQLGARVVVAGGDHSPETCPFEYTRVESYESLREELSGAESVIFHWLPAWGVEAVRDSALPSIEFVHRTDTADNDKSVATLLTTHSPFLADELMNQCGRLTFVVPHPIDLTKYPPAAALGVAVGCVTSYAHPKGIDVLLRAWAIIQNEFPDTPLRFYGSGVDQVELEALARELGVRAEFRPPVRASADVLPEYRCFVVPSRLEGFPLTILEALAMDVPVVASDIPGTLDFNRISDYQGFAAPVRTFPSEDHEALAEVLREVLSANVRPTSREMLALYYAPTLHGRRLRDLLTAATIQGRRREVILRTLKRYSDADVIAEVDESRLDHVIVHPDQSVGWQHITDLEVHRSTQFTSNRFPRLNLTLPSGTNRLAVRFRSPADSGQATVTAHWLDEGGWQLIHHADKVYLTPGASVGWRSGPAPTSAVRCQVTVRPLRGFAIGLSEIVVSAVQAEEPRES